MALDHDYKFCFAVNLMSTRSAQCLIFKPTLACRLFIFPVQLDSFLVSASFPASDAAGHNRIYLRAGLDHLSGHRGKQEAGGESTLTCSKVMAEVFVGFNVGLRTLKKIPKTGRSCPNEFIANIFSSHWRLSNHVTLIPFCPL